MLQYIKRTDTIDCTQKIGCYSNYSYVLVLSPSSTTTAVSRPVLMQPPGLVDLVSFEFRALQAHIQYNPSALEAFHTLLWIIVGYVRYQSCQLKGGS